MVGLWVWIIGGGLGSEVEQVGEVLILAPEMFGMVKHPKGSVTFKHTEVYL